MLLKLGLHSSGTRWCFKLLVKAPGWGGQYHMVGISLSLSPLNTQTHTGTKGRGGREGEREICCQREVRKQERTGWILALLELSSSLEKWINPLPWGLIHWARPTLILSHRTQPYPTRAHLLNASPPLGTIAMGALLPHTNLWRTSHIHLTHGKPPITFLPAAASSFHRLSYS